jgi:lysophosphatidylcholine acyltransferase/lyso-PAF acetyltransferase
MSWLAILCIYTIFIFLLSYLIYSKNQVYYRSLEYNNPETLEKIDVHKLYPEFAILDKNSFLRIFIGYYFYALPKFIINLYFAIMEIIQLNQNMKNLKNPTSDPQDFSILSNTITKWTNWVLRLNGIKVNKIKLNYEDVYRKYLGQDYDFNPDEKYSLIISNHTGFYDIIMNMAIHSCGFLAKEETKNYFLVGTISKGLNCLFVKRESKTDRERIFTELEKRQKDFYDGKILTPICLFPEGTTTNGKYILKFKRGAFYNLLPVKPQVMTLGNDKLNYSAAIGVGSTGWNYWRSLCYFGCNINVYDLPVIKPTEYMFEKFSYLGTEKWEIFAEVTRKIMCEIGQLPPSDKSYRNSKKYEDSLRKGEYEDEENKQLLEVKS